jgi:Fic family protein
LHQPPLADELPDRLDALCRFANEDLGEGFIHPVVRAIIVHFWMAYDHPFADGNGRTARALFYWAMLRKGYWLAQYLSISAILRKAPAQYARSYLYTETDGNDLTYFVIYQLQVESLLHGSSLLNHRQLVVVRDALRDPSEPFTISAQARRHRVANESARADLRGLEELGLLSRQKVGKRFVFRSVPDLPHRLRHLSRA